MGEREILAEAHHLGSAKADRRDGEARRFPGVVGDHRAGLAQILEDGAEHVRPGGRQQPDRGEVAALGGAGDQVYGVLIVELVDLEPASRRPELPAQAVDEDFLTVVVHLDEVTAEAHPRAGIDDPDLHGFHDGLLTTAFCPRPYRARDTGNYLYSHRVQEPGCWRRSSRGSRNDRSNRRRRMGPLRTAPRCRSEATALEQPGRGDASPSAARGHRPYSGEAWASGGRRDARGDPRPAGFFRADDP